MLPVTERRGGVELWELGARECIRDSLARYTWSGDALRLDELAETFCEDGELELRGRAPVRGRAAIVEFLGGVASGACAASGMSGVGRIVRHNVANIRFTEVTPRLARVASYFTVFTEIGLDHYGRYRDTFVPVGDAWLIQHRFVSTDWHAPDSTMARPSSVG
jgi:SnoaL-like domain